MSRAVASQSSVLKGPKQRQVRHALAPKGAAGQAATTKARRDRASASLFTAHGVGKKVAMIGHIVRAHMATYRFYIPVVHAFFVEKTDADVCAHILTIVFALELIRTRI